MNVGEPEAILEEIIHEINPPNRMNIHYDRSTSVSEHSSKGEDDDVEQSEKMEMALKWGMYGAQVALSTALFHPFSYARVLMEVRNDISSSKSRIR